VALFGANDTTGLSYRRLNQPILETAR